MTFERNIDKEASFQKKSVKYEKVDDEVLVSSALDGGWGWAVVFGAFMIHVISDGIPYSFGVLLNSFIDYFDGGRGAIGWLGSLMTGITWMSGPIAGFLINRFGCRPVTMMGSVLAMFSFVVSIFAVNILFMYFSFGIVAGLGLGMIYLPAIVSINLYFEKRRAFATGLAVCGSGFGMFIFAPFTQYLLEIYDWKGAVLIEAALLLHCMVFGALFRPLPERLEISDNFTSKNKKKTVDKDVFDMESSLQHLIPKDSKIITEIESQCQHAKSDGENNNHVKSASIYKCTTEKEDSRTTEASPLVSRTRSKQCPSHQSLKAVKKSTSSAKLTYLSLFKNPIFILFIITNFFFSAGFCVPHIFLPDRAKQLGISDSKAALTISILGIFNIVGRVAVGWVSDFKFVNRLVLFNVLQMLCGLCTCLSVVASSYTMLLIYAGSFGFFIGGRVALFLVVTVDLFGLGKLSDALGVNLFFCGIAATVGPPIAGWVFDVTGNYDASFYLMGTVLSLGGLIMSAVPCIRQPPHTKNEVDLTTSHTTSFSTNHTA